MVVASATISVIVFVEVVKTVIVGVFISFGLSFGKRTEEKARASEHAARMSAGQNGIIWDGVSIVVVMNGVSSCLSSSCNLGPLFASYIVVDSMIIVSVNVVDVSISVVLIVFVTVLARIYSFVSSSSEVVIGAS